MAWLPHCFWCERRRIGWWYNARVELHWWRDARQKGLQKWSFRQMCCSRSMVGIKTETFEKTWMEGTNSEQQDSFILKELHVQNPQCTWLRLICCREVGLWGHGESARQMASVHRLKTSTIELQLRDYTKSSDVLSSLENVSDSNGCLRNLTIRKQETDEWPPAHTWVYMSAKKWLSFTNQFLHFPASVQWCAGNWCNEGPFVHGFVQMAAVSTRAAYLTLDWFP